MMKGKKQNGAWLKFYCALKKNDAKITNKCIRPDLLTELVEIKRICLISRIASDNAEKCDLALVTDWIAELSSDLVARFEQHQRL
ncbi:hypothetical protein [Mixta mediterraneensis]|uniref:hypothetical protein n=1 Tax=Mixta mediterraneensis TaxID=2758443 RepID=UPI0018759600|nr:hypothetical protein [Mixta mediterraneensis]MBE5254158.1 hypothetical protein [Mixta mediterraneensis]